MYLDQTKPVKSIEKAQKLKATILINKEPWFLCSGCWRYFKNPSDTEFAELKRLYELPLLYCHECRDKYPSAKTGDILDDIR